LAPTTALEVEHQAKQARLLRVQELKMALCKITAASAEAADSKGVSTAGQMSVEPKNAAAARAARAALY